MATFDQERILRDNRRISIQMEQLVNSALAPWGMTAAQTQILLYVLRHSQEGTTLTQIHREFGYSMASLSGIIKRLKEKGFAAQADCGHFIRTGTSAAAGPLLRSGAAAAVALLHSPGAP